MCIAALNTQEMASPANGQAMLRESLSSTATNHSITWPDSVSLYKRGELTDLWQPPASSSQQN